jgi:hypothetical protein
MRCGRPRFGDIHGSYQQCAPAGRLRPVMSSFTWVLSRPSVPMPP